MAPSRKILAVVAAGVCLLLAGPLRAGSIGDPAVDIFVGSGLNGIAGNLIPPEPGDLLWEYSASETTADYAIQAEATIDPDPFVTYGFSVMSFTNNPLLVSKHYSIPVTGGPWNTVVASLSISGVGGPKGIFIDSDGGAQKALADGQDLQVALGGDCSSPRAGALACYSESATRTFTRQSFNTLDVYVSFVLSGKGSGATVSGRVELLDVQSDFTQTPEPACLSLGGLLAIAGATWLRRRNQPA